MAGNCESRQVYYPGVGDDPTILTESWLANQLCPSIDASLQYCWVDGDYVYFKVAVEVDEPSVGLPPTVVRKILVNDLDAILRNDSDEQLYWDVLT